MARNARQLKILELINEKPIDTQDALVKELINCGFLATQATVSRDIKDLGLIKKFIGGVVRYSFDGPSEKKLDSNISNMYKNAVVSITPAKNLIVVKTLSGAAQAVAFSIDRVDSKSILGSIAGDDTIFIATKSDETALEIAATLKEML